MQLPTVLYYYCSGWFIGQKRATDLWDEQRARAAHECGKSYTALVGSATSPTHALDVQKDNIGVAFLDALLREYMVYSFSERLPGRLFLSVAIKREFDGTSDRVTVGTFYRFWEDGRFFVEQEIFGDPMLDSAEGRPDVSDHWEPFPGFGDYASLYRPDRNIFLPDLREEPT